MTLDYDLDTTRRACCRFIHENSVPAAAFDGATVYCYSKKLEERLDQYDTGRADVVAEFERLLDGVKAVGQGKKCDSVFGVSGGSNSFCMVHQKISKWGLHSLFRTLADATIVLHFFLFLYCFPTSLEAR